MPAQDRRAHITADYGDARSDTAADLGRFLDDLPECLDQMHVEPDVIFFTGDVAQSGAEEEYEVAKEFFDHVQDCLPTRSRQAPLLMIPGNHDVTWSAINPARDLEIRRELKLHGDSHSILDKHGDYLSERQLNYREFSNKSMRTVTTPTADALGFTHTVPAPKRGVRVGIAGLNSSWLSTRDDLLAGTGAKPGDFGDVDLQRLHLSAGQMRLAAASLSNANVKIALMHHGPLSEWYDERDRAVQRQELTRFDFVLRGHQHEPCARVDVKISGRDDFMELATGALRTWPHWYQGFMGSSRWMVSGVS